MAFVTYPLNNIEYQAEDAELFHCTRTSGIWAEDSFPITVTGADNNVTIGAGVVWINNEEFSGKVAAMKAAETFDLGIADSVYPRIDVLAIQFSVNANATSIVVKKGSPASSPVRPAIVRTGSIYELYLCAILRPAGATTITSANVTDLRLDPTVCGLMADSVTSIDTSAINAQVEALIANLEAEIEAVRDTSGLMFEAEWVDNDSIPVIKGGTGASDAQGARENLELSGSRTYDLVWENARPTSAFAEQTIDLDLSGYDSVEIEVASTASATSRYYLTVKNGKSASFQTHINIGSASALTVISRLFTILNTGVEVDAEAHKSVAAPTTTASTNSYAIPTAIYGIKEVV